MMSQLRNGRDYRYHKDNSSEGVGPAQPGPSRNQNFPNPSPAPALAPTGAGPKTSESASPAITLLPSEDEDSILDEPPMEVETQEKKSLLALRQSYKKTKSNLDRAHSHLDFIQGCMDKEKVPRGLQVNVKCNALMADLTPIKEQFKETTKTAEKSYSTSLRGHYVAARNVLKNQVHDLEDQMKRELERASKEEKEMHTALMMKTKENLEKHQKTLEERKRKKLESLERPPSKRPRDTRKKEDTDIRVQTRQRQGGSGTQYNRPYNRQDKRYNKPSVVQPQRRQQTSSDHNRPAPLPACPQMTQGPLPACPQMTQGHQPPQMTQGHQPQDSQADMSTIVTLLQRLIQNGNQGRQPPMLLQQQPCAVGPQPPQLQAPAVSVLARQPPPLLNQYQQGFR